MVFLPYADEVRPVPKEAARSVYTNPDPDLMANATEKAKAVRVYHAYCMKCELRCVMCYVSFVQSAMCYDFLVQSYEALPYLLPPLPSISLDD